MLLAKTLIRSKPSGRPKSQVIHHFVAAEMRKSADRMTAFSATFEAKYLHCSFDPGDRADVHRAAMPRWQFP